MVSQYDRFRIRQPLGRRSVKAIEATETSQPVAKVKKRMTRWQIWTSQVMLMGSLLFLVSLGGMDHPESASASVGWLSIPPELSNALQNNASTEKTPLETLPEKQEDADLKNKLQALILPHKSVLKPYVYVLDISTGAYVNWHGDDQVAAASVIKLPILAALYQRIDQGSLTDDTLIKFEEIHRASGSGEMQYQKAGQLLTAKTLASKMIQISDNTASNILIDHLGGIAALNDQFSRWGLSKTHMNNWLPDLMGTNTISPREMAQLLYNLLLKTTWLSKTAKGEMLDILHGTHNRRLLPAGLPKDVTIAHKTGDIGWVLGDMGLVQMANGKDYLICVMVERPRNNPTARTLINQISATVYAHFNQKSTSVVVPALVPNQPEADH